MAGHILLAEDDKALSALMQDFFRAAGVTVTPAYDGEQALVLAQAQPFDLLVRTIISPSRFRFRCWWQRRRRSCGGPAGCGWARVSSATRIS